MLPEIGRPLNLVPGGVREWSANDSNARRNAEAIMSTEERLSPRQPWPTWPAAPGIPIAPEAWRRPAHPRSALARNTVIVAAAFVGSRALGLAREVIVAHRFGTSGETSAYVAAFRIPDLLFLVVMAGAFGSAFIPVFSRFFVRDEEDQAWSLASSVLNLAVVTVALTAVVAFVAAEPLVRYLVAPNLTPALQELTVQLMRVLLLSPILLGLGIAAKGILEARDHFLLPALAPLVYNAAIILGALFLTPTLGIFGLAAGVVAGAAGHALIQLPGLRRVGMRYRPRFSLRTEGLAEVWRLLLPRVIGQAAFQVNFIVVTGLASGLGDAAISALNFAWQLLMLPHGVLALSISTVIFPTMARLYGEGRTEELRVTFGNALRPLLFLSLPAAVGLYFFRTAIVQTIFQAGAFSAASTSLVVPALAIFALGLVAYGTVEILTRAFYAMHDTRTPVVAGVATIGLNIAIGYATVGRFGLAGLAAGLSLSTALEGLLLLAVLRRRLGDPSRGAWSWLGRVVVATAGMAVVASLVERPVTAATATGIAPRPIQLLFLAYALGVVGAAYAVTAHLLRLPEVALVARKVGVRVALPGWARRLMSTRRT